MLGVQVDVKQGIDGEGGGAKVEETTIRVSRNGTAEDRGIDLCRLRAWAPDAGRSGGCQVRCQRWGGEAKLVEGSHKNGSKIHNRELQC